MNEHESFIISIKYLNLKLSLAGHGTSISVLSPSPYQNVLCLVVEYASYYYIYIHTHIGDHDEE